MVTQRHVPEREGDGREPDENGDTRVFSDFCLSLSSKPLKDGVLTPDTGGKWDTLWTQSRDVDLPPEAALALAYPLVQLVELELPIDDDRRREAYEFFATALTKAERYSEAIEIRERLTQWFGSIPETDEVTDVRSFQNTVELAACYQNSGDTPSALKLLTDLVPLLSKYVGCHGGSADVANDALRIAESMVDMASDASSTELVGAIYRTALEILRLSGVSVQSVFDLGRCDRDTPFNLASVWYIVAANSSMTEGVKSDLRLRALKERFKCCNARVIALDHGDQTANSFPVARFQAREEAAEALFDILELECTRKNYRGAALTLKSLFRFAEVVSASTTAQVLKLANSVIENLEETENFEEAGNLYIDGISGFPRMPFLDPLNALNWTLTGADFLRRIEEPALSNEAFRRAGDLIENLEGGGHVIPIRSRCEYLVGQSAAEIAVIETSEVESAAEEFFKRRGNPTEARLKEVLPLCSEADFQEARIFEIMARSYLARFAQAREDTSGMLRHLNAAKFLMGSTPASFPIEVLGIAGEIGLYFMSAEEYESAREVMRLAYDALCSEVKSSELKKASAALNWANAEFEFAQFMAAKDVDVDCPHAEAAIQLAEEAVQAGFDALRSVDKSEVATRIVKLGLLQARQDILRAQGRFREAMELDQPIMDLEKDRPPGIHNDDDFDDDWDDDDDDE